MAAKVKLTHSFWLHLIYTFICIFIYIFFLRFPHSHSLHSIELCATDTRAINDSTLRWFDEILYDFLQLCLRSYGHWNDLKRSQKYRVCVCAAVAEQRTINTKIFNELQSSQHIDLDRFTSNRFVHSLQFIHSWNLRKILIIFIVYTCAMCVHTASHSTLSYVKTMMMNPLSCQRSSDLS